MTLPGCVGLMALPLCGMLAAVLGFVALARINRSGGALRGRGLALAAVILGGLLVAATPVVTSRAIVGWMTEPMPLANSAPAGLDGAESAPAPGAGGTLAALGGVRGVLMSCGVAGALVILLGIVTLAAGLVAVISGATGGRGAWLPLVPGTLAGVLGVLGTLIGVASCFQVISQMAGAANPADLARGLSQSLVTTWMGAIAFVLGLGASVLAAILGHARRRRFEEATAAAAGQGVRA